MKLAGMVFGAGPAVKELQLGVATEWKSFFSDILRQGIVLIPGREKAVENERLAASYQDFSEFVSAVTGMLKIERIPNLRNLLAEIRSNLKGGEIAQMLGSYTQIVQGRFRDCSAVVLFKRREQFMVCEEADGRTSICKGETFDLFNPDSYVAVTST
ncbi:hypothetical protein [Brevibacillus massiliensis]|uniref:hypothetical protein n=1 Tax=Brevibacillus massiliensis TaxID=1118054 RepID=UPI000309CC66|nr:hypothetical protein [Brevibacillus massiliensis]